MYVDGFLVPVPKGRVDDYRRMAEGAADVWCEYGALSFVECRADDVSEGEVTSFSMAVKLEKDEIVFFSWITYRDRAHRDEVNAKVMADPRMKDMPDNPPFSLKRMIFGGFQPVVER